MKKTSNLIGVHVVNRRNFQNGRQFQFFKKVSRVYTFHFSLTKHSYSIK